MSLMLTRKHEVIEMKFVFDKYRLAALLLGKELEPAQCPHITIEIRKDGDYVFDVELSKDLLKSDS